MAVRFVRLKLRLFAGGLRAGGWRVGLFVIGSLLGVFAAVLGYVLFSLPGLFGEQRTAELIAAAGGSLIVLGWVFLPLLYFGVDESLDPARFALLPLRRPVLLRGLFAAALVGIPPLATYAATLGLVHSATALGGVAAGVTELAGVTLGLGLCVALSRAMTSAFATGLRSRRSRDRATVVLACTAALLGPIQLGAASAAENADWRGIARVTGVLAWTPLGAPYSLGLDVAAGRAWAVPVKVLIVAGSIALLLWWWSATLERAMLGAAGSAGSRQRASTRTPVGQLVPRWLPRTRFGALAARETRYWWRETRRRTTLISFAVVGVFVPLLLLNDASEFGLGAMLVFIAALGAVSLANQFGFDRSAYAANVVAGVPGRVELASRVAGFSVYVLPALLVITVVMGVVGDWLAGVPAVFGTVVAAYGAGLAIVLPLSVRAAYALPDSTSPFAMNSGAGPAKALLSLAALVGAALATLPLQLVGWLLADVWRWVGLPIGIAYGIGALALGLRLAGPLLDRRMPELLATIS
ncbi:ABC transporter permease [Symbioplanes lichenis]|uniref:ABC transporter permease n=1 Tax=Symbioplanes lichenis TaxID=1629072 RepID=UPI00273A5044|nr:ABC transporter permease [Actinoplanes lichenis]